MNRILAEGDRELFLGNEAITRGCLEAGVKVTATYPGTPSSEIGLILEEIASDLGVYFEYSINEKVALELCGAAAASGLRSFAFMKHVGLNVASDAFMTLAYTGVRGGLVVLSADDPSAHSSQNEQDNRYYAKLALVPMLEPSTPAEAKQMTVEAFRLSEELGSPILLRTTTRVNHARGIVPLGRMVKSEVKGHFEKDPSRFVVVPAVARMNRIALLKRNERARELSEASPLNYVVGKGDIGIITSGIAFTYAREWLEEVAILKVGFSHPLPEKKIEEFLRGKKMVVVLEELEPYLEDEVLRIAKAAGIGTRILGKRSGHLPRAFEYSPDTILSLNEILPVMKEKRPVDVPSLKVPSRPPVLCAGCPHRATYYAVKRAVGKEGAIYSSDIGCYTLGVQAPLQTADFLLCMGSSVGAAGGFAEATDQHVVAFIGDSTFFHAGIPPLISAVFNNHKFLLVILDNRTTAMTGHQPNPGTGRDYGGISTPPLDLEPLIKGCGVSWVRTVDPYNMKSLNQVMKDAVGHNGLSVVIARHPCPLATRKEGKLVPKTYQVNNEKCVKCYTCVEKFSCPALSKSGAEVLIEPSLCIGCSSCAQVCPKKAIEVVE